MLHTDVGLRVAWDGDGYLELTVPKHFKTKMCGLCGQCRSDI